jgi:hypothetical protein
VRFLPIPAITFARGVRAALLPHIAAIPLFPVLFLRFRARLPRDVTWEPALTSTAYARTARNSPSKSALARWSQCGVLMVER